MIIAAFLFISILLVWLIIGARGAWYLKLTMLLTSVLLGISIYQALNSYKGWAYETTWEKMAGAQATLLAFETKEPDSIWLWIIPSPTDKSIFAYRSWPGEPIGLRLPYRRSTAKQLNELKKDQYGHAYITFATHAGIGNNRNPDKDAMEGSMSIGLGEIYQLPPPKLPEKNQ